MSKRTAPQPPTYPSPPLIVDADEAAKFLNISLNSIRWLTKTRQIPFVRLGERVIKFDINRLTVWLSERENVDLKYNVKGRTE